MKKNRKVSILLLCTMFLLLAGTVPAAAGEQVTISGTVNAAYQIITDDQQAYDVAESEKGDEVVEMIGRKVKVSGTVEEQDGAKVIFVTFYEVVEE